MTEKEGKQAELFLRKGGSQHTDCSPPGPADTQSESTEDALSVEDSVYKSAKHTEYYREEERVKSFQSWPSDHCQTPRALAGAGFYYCGVDDKVECFFCGGTLLEWEPGDDPCQEHARTYPRCKWIRRENTKNKNLDVHLQTGKQNENKKDSRPTKASVDAMNSKDNNVANHEHASNKSAETRNTPSKSTLNKAMKHVMAQRKKLKNPRTVKIMLDPDFNKMFTGTDMSKEVNRRNTFITKKWPNKVSPSAELCSAGFCYTGEGDTVVCFSCKVMISSWDKGDIPTLKHQKTSRRCKFVNEKFPKRKSNRLAFDCMVSPAEATDDATSNDHCDKTKPMGFYESEYNRITSFKGKFINSGIDPESLASAGFYKDDGPGDSVTCFACFTQIRGWKEGDSPLVRHANMSPHCPFVSQLDTGNTKMTDEEKKRILTSPQDMTMPNDHTDTMVPAEDHFYVSAKHRGYYLEKDRIRSFSSWPANHCQKPETLAAAGFFSCGPGDSVTCFYCGGELLDWEPGDDPWEEHARSFPDCEWIQLEKCNRRVTKIKITRGLNDDDDEPTPEREQTKQETAKLTAEVEMMRERNLCKICLDEEVEIVFIPCKHLAVCEGCADKVDRCPMCQEHIDELFFVFVP